MTRKAKYVYFFGGGKSEGKATMKNLLGGKGANLAEMCNLGLPVPPGFTITTEVCDLFYKLGRKYPKGLDQQIDENITELQAAASEQAEREMQLLFIMDKVAKDQELEATPEEVNSRIAEMARAHNRRPERLRQELATNGTLGQVHQAILEEKALKEK